MDTVSDSATTMDASTMDASTMDASTMDASTMELNINNVSRKPTANADCHVKKKKQNGEPPGQCHICLKMFSRVSVMKLHLKTHNSDRHYFECDICHKKITNKSGFISHFLENHCTDKPYVCESCPKRFGTRKSFKRHASTHTALRKFKCHVCLISFKEKSVLKTHMKKHIRKPVTCKFCFSTLITIRLKRCIRAIYAPKHLQIKRRSKYTFLHTRQRKNFDVRFATPNSKPKNG